MTEFSDKEVQDGFENIMIMLEMTLGMPNKYEVKVIDGVKIKVKIVNTKGTLIEKGFPIEVIDFLAEHGFIEIRPNGIVTLTNKWRLKT